MRLADSNVPVARPIISGLRRLPHRRPSQSRFLLLHTGDAMHANDLSNAYCGVDPKFTLGNVPTNHTRFRPRNRLLATLPRDDLLTLWPDFQPVPLVRGSVLFGADEPLRRVYFVETGVVSLVAVFEDCTTSEMAIVGREGVVGLGTLLGGDAAFGQCVVRAPGLALAVEASQFQSATQRSPSLRTACEAYARAFLREALQTAACNSVHMVEERCARWLLMSQDRTDGEMLSLTQEHLAEMLGVCRSTVTVAAGALQRAGLIRYHRGTIRVLDRLRLERVSCECYRVIRSQYERLLPRTFEP
jgi:CRP-like cAMP-binding protein